MTFRTASLARVTSIGALGYAMYIAVTCPCNPLFKCHYTQYVTSLLVALAVAIGVNRG